MRQIYFALLLLAGLPAISFAADPLPDRAQMVGENSLYLSDEYAAKLKAQLETELHVTLTAEAGITDAWDNDMVYFLFDFFNFARPAKPVQLIATNVVGPKLVWTEAGATSSKIYFAKNSGASLFAHVVRKEADRRGLKLEGQHIKMEIAYSNELLKQLVALLDNPTMVHFVES